MVSQNLKNNCIDEPRDSNGDESEHDFVESQSRDNLKRTSDTMYASTGDTTWLAF